MKCITLIFICFVSVFAQDGNQRFVRADELRDHPGRCFDSNRCTLRKLGETWTVDVTCEKATCIAASNGTLIERRTRCREISPIFSESCYIVRIEGKPFPECCPKLYCGEKLVSFTISK